MFVTRISDDSSPAHWMPVPYASIGTGIHPATANNLQPLTNQGVTERPHELACVTQALAK